MTNKSSIYLFIEMLTESLLCISRTRSATGSCIRQVPSSLEGKILRLDKHGLDVF